MIQEKMIEDLVRKVIENMAPLAGADRAIQPPGKGLDPDRDYPLAANRPDLIRTPTGKSLDDLSLNNILNGQVGAQDLRISPDTLRMQAEIAEGVCRKQFANNLRRAAELTAIPDERILEIYNALRPYRSTKAELLEIAAELESKYQAAINAHFIREAAEVYERRQRLRAE